MDNLALSRWRTHDAVATILALADHAKQDTTYRPISTSSTSRWHVRVDTREFELLLSGPKFWDTRAKVGGGGAIDLAAHLMDVDFKGAVRALKDRGL